MWNKKAPRRQTKTVLPRTGQLRLVYKNTVEPRLSETPLYKLSIIRIIISISEHENSYTASLSNLS